MVDGVVVAVVVTVVVAGVLLVVVLTFLVVVVRRFVSGLGTRALTWGRALLFLRLRLRRPPERLLTTRLAGSARTTRLAGSARTALRAT